MEVATNYTGFRRRFVAWFIDAIILGTLFAIIGWLWYITANPTDGQAVFLVYFIWLIASSIYVLSFWTWRGQTPGKMVMKIKIIRSDGRPFGISRVMLRFVGYIAPAIIMLILFIFVSAVFTLTIINLATYLAVEKTGLVSEYSGLILGYTLIIEAIG